MLRCSRITSGSCQFSFPGDGIRDAEHDGGFGDTWCSRVVENEPAAIDERPQDHTVQSIAETDRSRAHGGDVAGRGECHGNYSAHLWVTVLAMLYGAGCAVAISTG